MPRSGSRWRLVTTVLALAACGGDEPSAVESVARIEVVPTELTLLLGDARGVSAIARNGKGAPSTVPMTWTSSDPAIVTVSPSALVTAVAPGIASITASAGGRSASIRVTVARARVARLLFETAPAELLLGATQGYRVTALGLDGQPVIGWTPAWSSGDTSVARIDAGGLLRAVGAGRTEVRVTVDTASATAPVDVRGTLDVAVTDLVLAQVIQDDSLSVPMIRGGLPMLVTAWATADARLASGAWLRASCADATGERWRDSVRLDAPLEPVPRVTSPAGQWLVPNDVLGTGVACHAVVDPAGVIPDTVRGNNRFPRSGARAVSAVDVPALDITFIPIVLGADGGATGNVTQANVEQYLVTARQLLPLARINARVGSAYTTSTIFGSGEDAAWRAILREVETKRQLDGYRGHYYGIVRPRPGITFVQFGGFGYLPGRTAVSIQVGWFNREAQARETVAHELGHNFSLSHAPCGGPATPDASFPQPDGSIGITGWDAWSAAQGSRSTFVSPETKDLMSYCRPSWISGYNFRKVMVFREANATSARVAPGPVVLVRGEVVGGRALLDPLFVVEGTGGDAGGTGPLVDVDVLDAAGHLIASRRVPLMRTDHGDGANLVTRIPVSGTARVGSVRLRTEEGASAVRRIDAGVTPVTTLSLGRDGAARITWDARQVPHLLLRDAVTGEVLAFASGGDARIAAKSARVSVAFSNGARRELRR